MRTRKRKPVALEGTSAVPENNPLNLPAPENGAFEASEKPNRISFNVTPEGVPDWERMLPKTKVQLTELLRSKSVQKELGISEQQAQQIADVGFGEDEANALLDLLGNIDAVVASKIYDVPMEITSQAFAFTPDHRKKINPPLARVLNKWGPAILKTWKDEIGVAIILFAVLNTQVTAMRMMEEKRKRLQPVPARTPVATMPTPPVDAVAPQDKSIAKPPDPLETIGINA